MEFLNHRTQMVILGCHFDGNGCQVFFLIVKSLISGIIFEVAGNLWTLSYEWIYNPFTRSYPMILKEQLAGNIQPPLLALDFSGFMKTVQDVADFFFIELRDFRYSGIVQTLNGTLDGVQNNIGCVQCLAGDRHPGGAAPDL